MCVGGSSPAKAALDVPLSGRYYMHQIVNVLQKSATHLKIEKVVRIPDNRKKNRRLSELPDRFNSIYGSLNSPLCVCNSITLPVSS